MTDRKALLFESLVRESAELLHVYVTACLGDASAMIDDVFQDTLVVAWERVDDYDPKRPFGAWLRGIARNLILAKQRERLRLPTLDAAVFDELELRFTALNRQLGDTLDEKLACLRDCMARLSAREKEALRIRYEEDLRGRPLADQIGTTVENAKKILQRARTRLLSCMSGKLSWGASS